MNIKQYRFRHLSFYNNCLMEVRHPYLNMNSVGSPRNVSCNLSEIGSNNNDDIEVQPINDVQALVLESADKLSVDSAIVNKITDDVEKSAPMPRPLTRVQTKIERKTKKSIGGFYVRRSCCWVFSLQTGIVIMTALDLCLIIGGGFQVFTPCLINTNCKTFRNTWKKTKESHARTLAQLLGVFFCTNIVILITLLAKFVSGLRFCYVIAFSPKISADNLYRGKMGHYQHRVIKVKRMRQATNAYFITSSLALVFNSLQALCVIIGLEMVYADFPI